MKLWQQARGQQEAWIRGAEHVVLRMVSFVFSVVSAHAIRWIFSPLDTTTGADMLQPYVTWAAAAGFGILGYFVSRGLAYRLMKKEPFWAYIPICLVVELVEIFANYAQAADVIQHAAWIHSAPEGQQGVLIVATYIVLSIIPLASVFLAVVDMDLERNKQKVPGAQAQVNVVGQGASAAPRRPQPQVPAPRPQPQGPVQGAPRPQVAPGTPPQRGALNPSPGVRPQPQPVGATS
ncbi:hypothetical protein KDA_25460 [Dictyobacter alpinus]|uniref:Uncharacterized protein n=1 Tax=Dictyobacter alpinus TaxID=2014873 RepID=A0A402B6V5_9CHLR|nr:hypothetical protein [Dictyobacter alpinus]GCE27062.1 hypothetical protein KDA_25460 [Dictyobacter alpinus]